MSKEYKKSKSDKVDATDNSELELANKDKKRRKKYLARIRTNKPGAGRPKKWTEEALVKLGLDLLAWMEKDESNLFFKEFLTEQDLFDDMISDHEGDSDNFTELIKKARKIQEVRLAKLGLTSRSGSSMAIFLLKNNHGYSDRMEVKSSDEDVEFDW